MHACHDLSASISRMHTCHFELLLDLIMVPIFWSNWTDPLISMLKTNCDDDSLDTTRSTELSIAQGFVFQFSAHCGVSPFSTHMNIRVLSKADEAIESLAFHRVIALLRTDRDHEQKLALTRLFALLPVAVSRLCFLDLLKVTIVSELKSPLLRMVHWSSRIHDNHTIFCVSGAFTGE